MKLRFLSLIFALMLIFTGCAPVNTSQDVTTETTTLKSPTNETPTKESPTTETLTTEYPTTESPTTEVPTTETPTTEAPTYSDISFSMSMVPAYSGKAYVAINNNTPFFKESDITDKSYEFYSELDALGRCGECIAVIGTDIMPTEDRGSIGNVKPSGWNQNKYAGLVDGNYLYNRCHLIGYQLTGENANTKNLITGTRYLNIEGMLPFENMVADYIKETNNHVLFRVTPIFEGNNLLASGVLMEAMSVEDKGEGILFCVYSYNMQPGIGINYYDGSNYLLEEVAPTVAPTEPPTTEAPTEPPTEPPTEAPPLSAGYCYKTATGSKYHSINDCGNTNPNKTTRITIEEAINMGLDACKKCW